MKRLYILHPFLFAMYSVLGVYAQNVSQVPYEWIFRPALIVMGLAILVLLIFKWIYKDIERAGFVGTLFIVWLFMGHAVRAVQGWTPFFGSQSGYWITFILISLPFLFLGSGYIWNKLSNPSMITRFLNSISIFLLILPLFNIVSVLPKEIKQVHGIRERQSDRALPEASKQHSNPDIYYIVLDAYGREDMLQYLYGFDNSDFIDYLKSRGFYLADQAYSNYPQTELSISSTMNYQYLDDLVAGNGDAQGRGPLRELVQNTQIRRFLEGQGYTFVALPSAALFTQIRDADVYYRLTPFDINEFEGLLISSSMPGVVMEAGGVNIPLQSYETHRRYIRFSLDTLKKIPNVPGPKFVFAHLLSPHPPFIFDRNGNPIQPDRPYSTWDASLFPGTTEEYKNGYIEQMIYLNHRLMDLLDSIIENSTNPPVIILQGDHGPGAYYDTLALNDECLVERYSIMSAYYLPNGGDQNLYPSISPVNSFRVVLNAYFGTMLEVLDDRSYFAGWLSPYVFTDVTEESRAACTLPEGAGLQP